MRMVVVLPAPLGPRKPWISPAATSRLDAVHRGERAVCLTRSLDRGSCRVVTAGATSSSGPPSRRGSGMPRGRVSRGARPTSTGVEPAARRSSSTVICAGRSGRGIAACWSRPPRARRTWVASAGNWFSVGSTGSHRPAGRPPRGRPPARRGSRTRRAGRRGPPRCARGCRQRARERHVERGVLVAIADPRAQDLARGGQAHRGLLLEQGVHVAHEPLRLRARSRRRSATAFRPRPRSPGRRSR